MGKSVYFIFHGHFMVLKEEGSYFLSEMVKMMFWHHRTVTPGRENPGIVHSA